MSREHGCFVEQDYAKVVRAGAELVMISPDTPDEHRKYAAALFGAELPYLYVSDGDLDIARRYGLNRKEEHPHGGFYYRSLWILDTAGVIGHRSVPWEGNDRIEEYQKLFSLIGSEPGEWRAACGIRK